MFTRAVRLGGISVAILMHGGLTSAAAQEYAASGLELSLNASLFATGQPSFTPAEPGFDVPASFSLGGRIGYLLSNGLFAQASLLFSPGTLTQASGTEISLNSVSYDASLGYNLPVSERFHLFFVGGAGATSWSPEGLPSETDLAIHLGSGVRAFVTSRLAIRGDLRYRYLPDGLSATRRQLADGLEHGDTQQSLNSLELSVGVSVFPGVGSADADGDGVPDDQDLCASTPLGARVDAVGCPVDADEDAVPDHADRCPQTPAGADVDAAGCPVDSDADGVPDGLDRCSATPTGARADETGCPSDSDADGVFDGIDSCPDTPAGVPVDASGCTLDADGDGVHDAIDRCSGTPAGVTVGSDGCPLTEIERSLTETGRAVLTGVTFDPSSSRLRPESATELNAVARVLTGSPGLRVEIQGHTDAVGPAAENLRLSEARAQAVRDYLLATFAELDPGRIVARGYGESQPVASNQTEEGRRRNRRVELVVLP